MSKSMILLLLGVWLGLVLGLSFIEAPLKFQAPGITTELGLGIGKLVFGALNKIEIVFSFLVLTFYYFSPKKDLSSILIGAVIILLIIVFVQSVFLLPALNARVERILSNQYVRPSIHHLVFIGLEISKVILLGVIFFKTAKQIH